jgi:SAM-dependent methyltransferase
MQNRMRTVVRFARNNAFVAGMRNFARRWKWRNATHDEVYDASYFAFVEKTTSDSAASMAESLVKQFSPASAVDVGCGTGVLIEQLAARGVQVRGIEFASAALAYCQRRGLDVESIDLSDEGKLSHHPSRSDLVISMEVAHQMPPSCAFPYVAYLCRLGDVVVFSSESPSYVDRRSLNSQYGRYWIDLFARCNFQNDSQITAQIKQEWSQSGVASWFCRNVLVFRKVTSTPA